jgi:hypothetical protein
MTDAELTARLADVLLPVVREIAALRAAEALEAAAGEAEDHGYVEPDWAVGVEVLERLAANLRGEPGR